MNTEIMRKASTTYRIAWENDKLYNLSPNYVMSHYSERWKLDINKCWTNKEFINTHEIEFSLDWKRQNFSVRAIMSKAGLDITCSCGKPVRKLCQHAALALLDEIRENKHHFEKLHKKELDNLPPEQLKLFKLNATYSGTEYDIHERFGRIYKYGNRGESRIFHQISGKETLRPNKPSLDKVRFVIPLYHTNGSMPFFLPFLSTDFKGKKFGKSYLLDPGLPQPNHHYTPLSLALENISRKMVKLYQRSDGADSVAFQQEMIMLWRHAIRITEKQPLLSFAHTYGWKLEKINASPGIPVDNQNIVLADNQLQLYFSFSVNDMHSTIGLELMYKGQILEDPDYVSDEHTFFMRTKEGEVIFVDDLDIANSLHHFRKCGYKCTVLKQDEDEFFSEVVQPLISRFHFTVKNEMHNPSLIEKATPDHVKKLTVSIVDDCLQIEPSIRYDNNSDLALSPEANICLELKDGSIRHFCRNKVVEHEFADFLEQELCSFYWEGQQVTDASLIPLVLIRKTNWLPEFIAKCAEKSIQIKCPDLKEGSDYYPYPLTWKLPGITETKEEYRLELLMKFGEKTLPLTELKDLVFKTRNLIPLDNDEYGWIGKAERDYFRPILGRATVTDDRLVVSSRHVLALDRVMGEIKSESIRQSIQQKKNKLNQLDSIPLVPIPETVRAELRPYQQVGFSWMVFLKEFNWGGILADEMGLGKTLQVITLLEHHFTSDPASSPALIVVPNSLLFNWAAEIEKFAPTRQYMIHHGTTRSQHMDAAPGSLIITTYGTLMSDVELFSAHEFSYFVLDESQSVKNRHSKRFKATESIKADHLIALSGTPIENGIEDLYTQFNLVNPNFFGSFSEFKKTYEGVVDGSASPETMKELQKTIDPFLLRRTKAQVAKELPERTETLLHLDMLPEQRKIYDKYRVFYKSEIEQKMKTEGVDKVKFLALEGLMKLRQICNSPCLLKDQDYPTSSVKLEKLIESLQAITKDHKVLVFSFFTSMLQMVSETLQNENIPYTYLDGQMKHSERQAAVETFQEDDSVRVFLISLRAGGTGLNLTAADYVYILDPWWNPAVESQAIGRSHRIGQENPVMAYKTICRNTVEEAILALQQRKKKLADDLILEETNLLKTLDKNDILRLFA